MPQRFLRPTFRQSRRFNRLDYFSQSFYIRLISLVDDYGRYDATPRILRNEAFPDGDPDGNDVPCAQIASSLTAMCAQTADMLEIYEVEGTQYLQLKRWKERVRTASKYPEPPNVGALRADCEHLRAPSTSTSASPTTATKPTVHLLVKEVVGQIKVEDATARMSALDQLKHILSTHYQRPAGHAWTYAEESELAEIARRPSALDELQTILAYHRRLPPQEKKFFPQSVSKFISKWDETLDRARFTKTAPIKSRPLPPLTGPKFTPSPELAARFRQGWKEQMETP